MTKKSPEEYFSQQSFGAGGGGEFTPAERAFMQKYLGLDEADILRKIGITPPSAPVAAQPVAVPPAASAPESVAPVEPLAPEAVPAEPEVSAPAPEPEAEPPVAGAPAAEPEIQARAEPEAAKELASAAPVAPPAPLAPAPTAVAAPASMPAPAAAPVPVPSEVAPPASTASAAEAPEPSAESDEPSLESIMRKAEEQQLVAFYLGEQEFVLPIIAVQEVIKAVPYTRLPSAPPLIAGVINLRGRVTPLLQLRELLGVPRTGGQDDGFIVICRRSGIQMGLIIDRVHTMYRVVQKDVDWAVEAHLGNVEVVSGLLKVKDRLLGIISVDKIFSMLLEA